MMSSCGAHSLEVSSRRQIKPKTGLDTAVAPELVAREQGASAFRLILFAFTAFFFEGEPESHSNDETDARKNGNQHASFSDGDANTHNANHADNREEQK